MSPRLTVRDPLFIDVAAILRRASAITAQEMLATGGFAVWRRDLTDDIGHRDGGGFTILADKRPVAILTHLPILSTGERGTSFAACQEYFDLGAVGVRFTRRAVEKEIAKYPGVPFVVTSQSNHPDLARWMQAIGLVPATPSTFHGGDHVQKVLQ